MEVGFEFEFTLLVGPEKPQVECLVESGLRFLVEGKGSLSRKTQFKSRP